MFQPRFHDAVRSGEKTQTIRPPRKRPIKPGDYLSLRRWIDRPYRSKQKILRMAHCESCEPITIDAGFNDNEMALADGFADAAEMREWFANTHGLPFSGELIRWA